MNDRLIAERVTVLLSHYWTANEDPALRELQMVDWLEDLSEFPSQYVASAIKEWRQGPSQNQRPKPGDIRLLCVEQQRAAAPKPLQLTAPVAKPIRRWNDMTPEEKAAHEVLMEKFREVLPEAKAVPRFRSDGSNYRPPNVETRPLPSEDDPAVQKILKSLDP